MPEWKAVIEKFGKKGEKTGWTYIFIPVDIAEKLNPDSKKSFRVKGCLDKTAISGVSLIPMGEGNYILPLKADLRKLTGKKAGAEVFVVLEKDETQYELNRDLMLCLQDDADALSFFTSLPHSHQNYFSKYVDAAKAPATKEKRIVQIVKAMLLKQDYAGMIRSAKANKDIP
ncbi:MAG: YdeI/OmpD-associated family protein [Chitinophagales bacterium]